MMADKDGSPTPWGEWISSEEGVTCVDFETLRRGPYLSNRLWRAFMAGQKAGEAARAAPGGRDTS